VFEIRVGGLYGASSQSERTINDAPVL
jgi:hypothetical protein